MIVIKYISLILNINRIIVATITQLDKGIISFKARRIKGFEFKLIELRKYDYEQADAIKRKANDIWKQ